MGKIGSCISTFGKATLLQSIEDLPVAAGTPLEIDLAPNDMVVQLCIYCDEDFYYTFANTTALGASRIGNDITRGWRPAGFWTFPIVGNVNYFYIIHKTGGPTTDAVSIDFVEGDT